MSVRHCSLGSRSLGYGDTVSATTDQAAAPDPLEVIRSKEYLRALVLAGFIALPVAAVAYGFLALID